MSRSENYLLIKKAFELEIQQLSVDERSKIKELSADQRTICRLQNYLVQVNELSVCRLKSYLETE